MRKLENTYNKKGFTYNLIARTDNKAIYNQYDGYGHLIGHECFIVQTVNETEAFGVVFPAREKYPTDNDFGVTAWSVGRDIKRAMEKYNAIGDFKCKGCSCELTSDYSLRTKGYCYLCDTNITLEELLSDNSI